MVLGILPPHLGEMGSSLVCKQLRAEWRAIARSADSRQALDALAAQEPAVAALGCAGLGELVDLVQNRLRHDQKAPVIAAMLHSSRAHPVIARALVQTLYPGLTRVVRALRGLQAHWGDLDGCFDEAVVVLWTVLDEWAGSDRLYVGPDVLSAVRCRMRRQALAAERERRHLTGLELVADRVPAAPDRSDLEDLAAALDEPASLGLDPASAATICLTRVYGYTLGEVAAIAGTTRGSVKWRRNRAEQCLVA